MKNIGSKKAENKEEVDRHITATETVDTLIDSKKNIQCKPTIIPIPISDIKSFREMLKSCFLKYKNNAKTINAINILYQTRCRVFIDVISFPRIPVKPNTITIICSVNKLFFSISLYM